MKIIKILAVAFVLSIVSLFEGHSTAATLTIYGSGGVNLKEGTICPNPSTQECATLVVNGSEIKDIILARGDNGEIASIMERYTLVIENFPHEAGGGIILGQNIRIKLIPK